MLTTAHLSPRRIPVPARAAAATALLATAALAAPAPDLYTTTLDRLALRSADVQTITAPEADGERLEVAITMAGERYTLELLSHSNRSDRFEVRSQGADGSWTVHDPGAVKTYRGRVRELKEDTFVAAALRPSGRFEATVFRGEDRFYVESLDALLGDLPEAAGYYVGYFAHDILEEHRQCSGGLLAEAVRYATKPVGPRDDGQSNCGGSDPICVTELGIDADVQYFNAYGSVSAVQDRIESVINTVNVQYERDVDITHEITTILVRTAEPDPYTSSDAGTLLVQFQNEWNNNQGGIQRDVAQLFTGRGLNGGTIGIAYISAICNSFAYSVVESDFSGLFSCVTDLSAHELGHNWGADHCGCSGHTMNAFITCTNQFEPNQTIPDIVSYRNTRSCLEAGVGGGGPENDQCEDASTISDGVTSFSTIGADTDGPALPGSCDEGFGTGFGSDIWYDYVASCTGDLTVSTCDDADYDTRLAIYSGTGCTGALVGCNDDGPDCANFTSELTVPVVAGSSYKLRVGGFDGEFGSGQLTLSCADGGGGDLTLTQDPVVRGTSVDFTVTGAESGETVQFGRSSTGIGSGPCIPSLGGLCLDILGPVSLLGTATADGSGTATLTVTIPASAPLGDIFTQAAIERGPGGADSVKSNAVAAEVLP